MNSPHPTDNAFRCTLNISKYILCHCCCSWWASGTRYACLDVCVQHACCHGTCVGASCAMLRPQPLSETKICVYAYVYQYQGAVNERDAGQGDRFTPASKVSQGGPPRSHHPRPSAVVLLPYAACARSRATSHRRYSRAIRRPNLRLAAAHNAAAAKQAPQHCSSSSGGSGDGKCAASPMGLKPHVPAAPAAGKSVQDDVGEDGTTHSAQQPMQLDGGCAGNVHTPTSVPPTAPLEPPPPLLLRPLNRSQRRRPALLQRAMEASCRRDPLAAVTCSTDSGSPAADAPRRLETHVWHARRMRMVVRYAQASPYHPPSPYYPLPLVLYQSSLQTTPPPPSLPPKAPTYYTILPSPRVLVLLHPSIAADMAISSLLAL